MDSRRLQIPNGMQDTLPGECLRKRQLEQQLRESFRLCGYQEIETPILELYDALDDATFGYRPEKVWKTFDARGRVLAIRPDTTIPAVRLAAGRLKEHPLPLRLCYMQSAAAYESDTVSMLCEKTQAGVELMGASDPAADAEVIALAVQSLRDAGLTDFQIELGQAMFFDGFMQEAGLTHEQSAQVRRLTEEKNALALQLYLKELAVSEDAASRLMRLPQLYGDASVLTEAEALTSHPMCRAAIDNLRQIMDCLTAWGCADCLTIDLGMVHQANYYSGMIFRGITARLGEPLLSGGRYDGLPARFGREIPAVGFALNLKLLMMALENQGERFPAPEAEVLVGFEEGALPEAIRYVTDLRAQGKAAVLVYGEKPQNDRAVWMTKSGASAGKEA